MFRLFKKRREAVKKYLLILFLSVVSIGMIITLAPIPGGDTGGMEANILAQVGGQSITILDLQRSIQSRLRNSPLANDPQVVTRVAGAILDDMILRRAVWAQAKKLGITVSDAELRQNIQTSLPFLYPNGVFVGLDRYRDFISQQTGMSVAEFEAQLRESILQEKMRAIVTDGIRVTPAEVHEEFTRRNSKARIEYVLFDPGQFLKAVQVSPKDLETFFKEESSRYKVPEERRVRYVLIDMDRVRALAKVTEADLKQYYSQHLSDYRVPDRVKVAHILFKTEGKTPEEIATVEKTAHEVLAKIKSGADFGEMAKKYSEDSSAANGGLIGWIVHGQTVKAFEDAAFSMKPGQVSDLIKTTYGFHIIKVFDRQTAHLETFDEVKQEIHDKLEKQKLADAQESLAEQMEKQAKSDPQAFAAIAKKLGLEAKETPLFRYNQPVPDLGNTEAFENLAFQLRQGEVGVPITVPKGLAVIQVTEIVLEHVPKLEDIRATVEEDYRAAKSRELAAQRAKEFAAKAQSGDFSKLAQSMGLAVKESKDFTQQESVPGLASGAQLSDAFTLPVGKTSSAVEAGANWAVFRVVARTPANEADFAAQHEQIAQELLQQKRNLAWEIYRQNLKQQLLSSGDLKLNSSAMKQFLASYQKS